MTVTAALAEIDFTDLDNFADGFPHDLFAVHRREAPVYWHEPTEHTPDGEGFWSVAAYPETLEVLRDPVTYSSVTGGDRPFGGTLLQDLAIAGQVLNMMDDPRHSQIRRLVSSGLTPRMIRRVEDDLRSRSRGLLDAVVPGEPFDFVVEVAAELPMQMICILLGVPESERHWLFEAIEPQFDFGGSRKASLSQLSVEEAGSRMYAFGQELIAAKRARPTDDMLSVVANAGGGAVLSDLELYLFFSLLFSAGAETTRNAVAGECWRWPSTPTNCVRCVMISRNCPPPLRRSCAGPRRRRPSGAPPPATSRSVARPSAPAKRCRSGKAPPTATTPCSSRPTDSTSPVNPIRTWVLARVCITAWGQPGQAGTAGALRGTVVPVRLGATGATTGVDPQQPAHRPAPSGGGIARGVALRVVGPAAAPKAGC